jgi:hypothetical protein
MTANILDFRSQLTGGGFRNNLFRVDITFPTSINRLFSNTGDQPEVNTKLTETAQFLVKSAQVPSSDIGVVQVPFRGRELKLAGDRSFEPFSCVTVTDGGFRLRKGFEAWSRAINALTENTSELGFQSSGNAIGYTTDITLNLLSRDGVRPERNPTNPLATSGVAGDAPNIIRRYKLYGAWVSSISSIDLAYDANNQVAESSIVFQYQFYEVLPTP